MIIYNVTVKAEAAIADSYIQWLREEHIPDIVGTGCFTHATILRLLDTDDTEGPTFAVQYHTDSKGNYNRYLELFAAEMRNKSIAKWGERVMAFRTVMQVLA